ncbi:Uma2 family endonuclease [Nocardioides speluncae]|uniref:Uma2 family endonuclease n=1 Tax=Nocardioides speluncae TaxID=2670337 RepID=UPI001F0C6696|nr:Uma2 family endonuclease [Nocardioides speluncae]
MRPPRPEGWFAEDLDHLPDAPRHTELIDGALVFMMSPQRSWHGRLLTQLEVRLRKQAPDGLEIDREMTIRIDARNRPEADLLVTTATYEPSRTWYPPGDVILAVEVVSPESAHRDREVKLRKYAAAGIAHYWLIEDEDGQPAVHVYELDGPTRAYAPAGIVRDTLRLSAPFAIEIELADLLP